MVVGLATLKAMGEKGTRKNVVYFTHRLLELQAQFEGLGDILGPGLMIGNELVRDRKAKAPVDAGAALFVEEGLKRDVIFG